MEENKKNEVMSLTEFEQSSGAKQNIFTTLKSNKEIFNLEGECDYKLNDCEGQVIQIKDVLCKVIEKELKEPEIDEETGEIKDKEYKRIVIIIDNEGKSYVTASNHFFFKFMRFYNIFIDDIETGEGRIRIKKESIKNSNNKALGFEVM